MLGVPVGLYSNSMKDILCKIIRQQRCSHCRLLVSTCNFYTRAALLMRLEQHLKIWKQWNINIWVSKPLGHMESPQTPRRPLHRVHLDTWNVQDNRKVGIPTKKHKETHLMGLSFLQKFDQVWAAKTIKVRTKRIRDIFVLKLNDRASPL